MRPGAISPSEPPVRYARSAAEDVATFELDLASVRNTLIAAHQRRITAPTASDTEDAEVIDAARAMMVRLREAGIPVILDTRDALLHDKFAVVDGRIV